MFVVVEDHDAGYDVHTAVKRQEDAFADTDIVLLAVHMDGCQEKFSKPTGPDNHQDQGNIAVGHRPVTPIEQTCRENLAMIAPMLTTLNSIGTTSRSNLDSLRPSRRKPTHHLMNASFCGPSPCHIALHPGRPLRLLVLASRSSAASVGSSCDGLP